MSLKKFKQKRSTFRAVFTKTLNALNEEINKTASEIESGGLLDKFTKLSNAMNDIKELDNTILDLLLDNGSDEKVVNDEMASTEIFSDQFITVSRKVNEILLSLESTKVGTRKNVGIECESVNKEVKSRNYKLPKLNIPTYDGTLINYLSFWSQFKKIHEDPDLDDSDKFQYLLQAMEPGTRARDLLCSYPLTSENYPKAVEAFQGRFGKKDVLVEVYVRELLKLIISNVRTNGKERLPLADLFIKVDAYLRSLESMGVDSDANATWLFPMVESSLSEETLKAWQRSSLFSAENEDGKSRLSNLLQFLKLEVEGEERLQLAKGSFERPLAKEKEGREKFKADKYSRKSANIPSVAGLHISEARKCAFCDKSHVSTECFSARSMPLKERISKLKDKKCCLKCLKQFHFAKDCKQFVRCHICEKAHHVILCPELVTKNGNNVISTENKSDVVQSTMTNQMCSREVALMVMEVDIRGNGVKKRVRALLDSGSQKSYILQSTAEQLGLESLASVNVSHTLFGGAKTEAKLHKKYCVSLSAPGRGKEIELNCLDQRLICGDIPRLPKGPILKELKKHKIWVSDIGTGSPKIELLIGSDMYGQLLTGQVRQLQGGLTAIETRLGWTVCGQLENPSSAFHTNLAIEQMKVQDLWKLEAIGIMDPCETIKRAEEEEMAEEHFLKELTRKEDGRYCVALPWVNDNVEIPSNRNIAEKRLFNATKKLKAAGNYEDYHRIFEEWQEEGIIEKVPEIEVANVSHYLPHHPVIKPESSTTKIRPVFDASCKAERSPSLNDCLATGPNLIEQIPSILLRFREQRIGVTADIRKAFLQIEVKKEDQDYLRFLWWEKDGKLQVMRHKRVVFGVRSSPFLLGAVLRYHFEQVPERLKHFAKKLSKSFYVDNCVASVRDVEELHDFIQKSKNLLADAKMDLRMWEYGPASELTEDLKKEQGLSNRVPVLGLYWDCSDDSLMLSNKIQLEKSYLSKRNILAITQSVFDPIGILAPVLLPAKMIIQEAWTSKSSWDDPLPEDLQKGFEKWHRELKFLSDFKFPRRVGFGDRASWTIHVFSDASQNSYATAIFLRCEDPDLVSVQLIGAKSRLSPLKKMTIPRLELLACLLGARLCQSVLEALDLPEEVATFYSDSATALAWIQRNDQWGTFVGNRVKEICTLTNPRKWCFIPGRMNPADLPSRGCSPKQFIESKWWEGPEFLKEARSTWPCVEPQTDEEEILSEKRKGPISTNLTLNSQDVFGFERISKFSRMVRVLAWMRRFYKNTHEKERIRSKALSASELEEAEHSLWKTVQREGFLSGESNIKGLDVLTDDTGLIRLKTKIVERDDELSFRYPILLPTKHHVTTCLVREYHLKNCHAGVQVLASRLREKYWIVASKRLIRNVVGQCVRCKRFAAQSQKTAPIHLPLDRVRDAAAFEVTGIDLCGPLYLKNKSKAWVVLYTCAVYRAVHLEAVSSLSTDAYMQSLRRFIARRGRPGTIYTDNGTNFTGTSHLLKSLNWEKIQSSDCISPIRWKFIPPGAPWWGGFWERLIRSVKALLVRVLGRSAVNFEELCTILCDVESTINSRPLTYINEGSKDFAPLTPSMFLQDIPLVGVPDLDNIDRDRLLVRHNYCQQLREELRSRFRREYLGELVQRVKGQSHESSIKVGDIVLVGQDNQKRINWPMAKVLKIFPSRDGKARVVELKTGTGTGTLIRPLPKVFPLEVISSSDPICQRKTTRSGRIIKQPERLGS